MAKQSDFKDFYKAVLSLQSEADCKIFFEDICTMKELETMSQRLEVAKMLKDKQLYSKIVAETGASTATISRVSRAINEGFHLAFERLK